MCLCLCLCVCESVSVCVRARERQSVRLSVCLPEPLHGEVKFPLQGIDTDSASPLLIMYRHLPPAD